MIKMTIEEIKNLIKDFQDNRDECGFGIFAITNGDELKNIPFKQEENNNIPSKLKPIIFDSFVKEFSSEDSYESINFIADGQIKNYVIEENENFNPFKCLSSEPEVYLESDITNTKGLFFKLRKGENVIWLYQHVWPMTIPNKAKRNILMKFFEPECFEELQVPILAISQKINLMVIENHIVFNNIKFMESVFCLTNFINNKAKSIVSLIESKKIASNAQKINDYITIRPSKTNKYAKKILRIKDSKVLELPIQDLIEKTSNSNRWKDCIKFENNQIVTETYKDIETFIDFLDERFTVSPITDQEYDTEVKKIAK